MFTLLVGVLVVVGGALGFSLALFGRRPIPQPAMSLGRTTSAVPTAEAAPSVSDAPQGAADLGGALRVGWMRRVLQREASADHQPESDVTLSPWIRTRSALALVLIVAGLAAIIGGVLSVIVVGVVLLVT